MKNHELLDLIGEANEDYVREADGKAVRPRFRWKTLAASAACAALVVGLLALPNLTAEGPGPAPEGTWNPGETLVRQPGLHDYVLIDKGVSVITTEGDGPKLSQPAAPGGSGIDVPGQNAPAPDPNQPPRGSGPDPVSGDAPAQEDASAQYARLLQWLGGVEGREPAVYPEWFAGAWIDGEKLTVAIVDGLRTPELEAQITRQCGGTGDVLFTGAAYSKNYLDSLMEQIGRTLDELDCRVFLSYGVYVADNRIHLDFSAAPAVEVLAALAELDPAGDAIFIQVFTGARNVLTEETFKGPASDGPAPGPVDPEARATPVTPAPVDGDEPDAYASAPGGTPVPGGARPVDGLPETKEEGKPAHYDLLPLGG